MAKKINPIVAIVAGLFAVLLLFAIISIVLYPGPDVIEAASGDTVSVRYVGTYQNGTVFDSNQGENGSEPFTFVLGAHQVISGFENAVNGMRLNETKTVILSPEEAYPYHPEMVITHNKTEIVEALGSEPSVGDVLGAVTSAGVVNGVVTEVTYTTVVVDYNPPTAGQTLNFEITLVDIVKGESSDH